MTVTIEQRLAALGLDSVTSQVVSERYAIIFRDPEDDATAVPNDGTIYLRIVDLSGDPADPSSIKANIYIDQGSGEVQAFDDSSILAPWNGARSAYAESDVSSPYCFREFTFDQAPAEFASEAQITVHLDLTVGFGGWGNFDWGHEPWGTAPTSSDTADVYYDFTAADSIAPNLASAVCIDPWTVRATFDEGMSVSGDGSVLAVAKWVPTDSADPVGISAQNVDPEPACAVTVIAVVAVDGSGNAEFDLTLDTPISFGQPYQLQVRSTAEDSNGNAIDTAVVQLTGYEPDEPNGRNFSHWKHMIPVKNKIEDYAGTGDLLRVSNCFDDMIRVALYTVDHFIDQFDPDLASDAHIDQMLYDIGNPFNTDELGLTDTQKRKLLRLLVPIYQSKGTDEGLEDAIWLLLGERVTVVPHLSEGWSLGDDVLGEGSVAMLTSSNAETYDLSGNKTLIIEVSGVERTITFEAANFDTPASATADEVVAAIAADLTDADSFVVDTGVGGKRVVIYATEEGIDVTLEVTGGTAQSVLGFTTDTVTGTGGAILAPSLQYTLYSFDLEVETALDATTEELVRKIVDYMKPAHTHLVNIRTARTLMWPDGWVLGQHELDSDTEIAG